MTLVLTPQMCQQNLPVWVLEFGVTELTLLDMRQIGYDMLTNFVDVVDDAELISRLAIRHLSRSIVTVFLYVRENS